MDERFTERGSYESSSYEEDTFNDSSENEDDDESEEDYEDDVEDDVDDEDVEEDNSDEFDEDDDGDDVDQNDDGDEDYADDDDYNDDDDSFTEAIPIVTIRNELSTDKDSEESGISEMKYIEKDLEPADVSDERRETNTLEQNDQSPFHQDIPDYEPSFPELSETLDDPVLLLKTTVLSSTELLTKTLTQSRLRTYTFVITRVSGSEEIVTSTTEVKPQIKTIVVTEPVTSFTTLTLLDFDPTQTLTDIIPTSDNLQPDLNGAEEGRSFSEEPRYNLATRVMSNGVEVIVAGDKTTLPGKADPKRFLTADQKYVTLKPSTLTDQMMMMVPQDTAKTDSSSSDQFVTKTCLTTFTYITTFLEGSTTTVSSHEQVVSNVATEAREKGKILPTPTVGLTLTQNTNLSVGVFHTTYTYLNTILDGEQPLVISSEHTVANTVTAPNDYFSLLHPSETAEPIKDTNTYYSTIGLEKTLFEGDKTSVISTKEVVTQVVITESIPPRATSVMTSYIAVEMDENPLISSTDVLKTYFVTYTYYSTVTENGKEVVKTDISTASDVVTEQLYILPKKTIATTQPLKVKPSLSHLSKIQVAKSYLTTFTYYTTLLREENKVTSTIVSSRTSVVENLVTETIDPSLLDDKYLASISEAIDEGSKSVVIQASLQNGHIVEITAFPDKPVGTISPSKVMPIERTKSPETFVDQGISSSESSSPSVITGSTIIFVDDDPFTHLASTPVLKATTTFKTATAKPTTSTKTSVDTKKNKPSTKPKNQAATSKTKLSPTKTKTSTATVSVEEHENEKNEIKKPTKQASDLLGLGSLNINSLQALTPVINAMAGLISTNLKSNRRHDIESEKDKKPVEDQPESPADVQNRSPIYIPVRGLADDFEIAESQNIANFDWIEDIQGKNSHEASLLNGGIAISPGEIITTNSDVIVGRPGRIGPRIPSIPLHGENEIPIGMKPPPLPNSSRPKQGHAYKRIPTAAFDANPSNKVFTSTKDDYIGPPPPVSYPNKNKIEATRTVSSQNRKEHFSERVNPFYQIYAKDQTKFVSDHNLNEVALQESIQNKYNTMMKQSYPIYAPQHETFSLPEQNIGPSISNRPIVLPEVVERSTGQPLLVNIQPSQVAYVNIPFNRTTALIYGGSTEPHRNGQYFDDPSPYPEPEFSGIKINNGVPNIAPIHQNEVPGQKQVNSVLKVQEQTIKMEPDTSENQKVMVNIAPSKRFEGGDDQRMDVAVAPISYGVVHQGDDFSAHVINHGEGNINDFVNRGTNKNQNAQRWENFNSGDQYYPSRPSTGDSNYANKITSGHTQSHVKRLNDGIDPFYKENPNRYVKGNEIGANVEMKKPERDGSKVIQPKTPITIRRPKPTSTKDTNSEISEIMVPPPPIKVEQNNRHHYRRPLPIPLGSGSVSFDNGQKIANSVVFDNQYPSQTNFGQYEEQMKINRNRIRFPEEEVDDNIDDGEDGVFQESNSRPLLPGELPFEILRSQTGKTNETISSTTSKTLSDFNRNHYIPVVSQHARPFITIESVGNSKPDYVNANRPDFNQIPDNSHGSVMEVEHYNSVDGEKPPNLYKETMKVQQPQPNKKQQPTGIKSLIQNSSQKPVLIFIDENNDTTKDFFHHNKENRDNNRNKIPKRPSVTSLPIDIHTVERVTRKPAKNTRPSQTEAPFVPHRKVLPTNEIVVKNDVTTKAPRHKMRYPDQDLNTGEVTRPNLPSDLEILKPPPPTSQPPKNEVTRIKHYPTGERYPNGVITEASVPVLSSHRPFVPAPSEEMVPPPKAPGLSGVVIGMSPPPLTTPKSVPQPQNKTVFSMQIDTPVEVVTVKTTTEKNKYVRTRRPYTRRPSYRTTTSTSTTAATEPMPRPVEKTSTQSTTTEENVISPSPSIKSKPSMQVIIGHPNLDPDVIESSSSAIEAIIPSVVLDSPDLIAVESGIPTEELKKHPMTHHAGNEVKVVDETSTTINSAAASTARSKLLVPTKFVTYTLTSTVTITKTTVIESSGRSPSTMTILVTKTERSTIVDTITEVHTLVQPTSIIETVTTTLKQGNSLYPPDVHGRPYPSIQVKPTISITETVDDFNLADDDDLEEFIIHDDDYLITKDTVDQEDHEDPNSILIVMTDKNTRKIIPVPNETQERGEVVPDKVSNVDLAGIFFSHPAEEKKEEVSTDRCLPECMPSKNELCQKVEGAMRCVCRPGFARMFEDRPCLPTYTFNGQVTLERIGKDVLHFYDDLKNPNSSEFLKFAHATREGLDRMVMQSDLRDIFHGVQIHAFEPVPDSTGIVSKFYLQLSDNIEETRLEQILQKYLQSNNNSLGGTDIFASATGKIKTADFDECSDPAFHDCSENSRCFNLRGTYTCSCKEGFSDLSENSLYPGRICSADLVGCDTCSFHGTCYTRESNEVLCECFQWYTGEWCQINLKVLLIALVTLGAVLFVLLLVCVVATCVRRQPRRARANAGLKFLPQGGGTMDRRAMIQDTGSEDSRSETNETLPYVQQEANKKQKDPPKRPSKVSLQIPEHETARNGVLLSDQKDRSLTVMIPRAKYHPAPAAAANMHNYTSFDARKPSVPSIGNEAKLLSYLDAGRSTPNKPEPSSRKTSHESQSAEPDRPQGARKSSQGGALVSAGFEVSATVAASYGNGNAASCGTMETRGTEADRSENATIVQRYCDVGGASSVGTASHFNTLRKSLMDDNIGPSTDWMDIVPRVMTVSEVRSFDETTIPPPMRVFRSDCGSKPSSQHQNDEANTMAERDLGSTFLLPHTHLYKPDRRESDASGFESL